MDYCYNYGGSPNKLLCTWHVDRAWRKNLSNIPDKDKQRTVYFMLRVLLEEMDQTKFECLLKETILEWEQESVTAGFCEYFHQYYAKKAKQWAGCYRKQAFINTNMFAESFHRVLKHVYLKGTEWTHSL